MDKKMLKEIAGIISLNESIGGRLKGLFRDLEDITENLTTETIISDKEQKSLEQALANLLKQYEKTLKGKGLVGW